LKSVELPATGAALVDCHPVGGRHVADRLAPEAKEVADADDERTEKHALQTRALKTTRQTPSLPRLDTVRIVTAFTSFRLRGSCENPKYAHR
jgi:hypothetical protein